MEKLEKPCSSHSEKVKSTLLRPDKKRLLQKKLKIKPKPSIVEALRRGNGRATEKGQ
ncbi:MAG: hypothetical protein ACLUFI_02480 [Oscillospiraceae bacterium]